MKKLIYAYFHELREFYADLAQKGIYVHMM